MENSEQWTHGQLAGELPFLLPEKAKLSIEGGTIEIKVGSAVWGYLFLDRERYFVKSEMISKGVEPDSPAAPSAPAAPSRPGPPPPPR